MMQFDSTLKGPSENFQTASGNQNNPQPNQPKKGYKVWLKALLLVLTIAVLMLAGVLAWVATTESGLRFGLYRVPALFGVKINSKTLKGTLLKGFNGDNWHIETESVDLDINGLVFNWNPDEFWHKKLHIKRLTVGDIHLTPKDAAPKENNVPTQLPEKISLPVQVQVDSIEIGRVTSGPQNLVLVDHANASYLYDHKQHKLNLSELQTPWLTSSGVATLDLVKPYKLDAEIKGNGVLDEVPIDSYLQLGGNLQNIVADLGLSGRGVGLTADAVIHPFAEKLDDKIGSILAKGKGVNPQAFMKTLPKADLDFDATVVPSFTHGVALEGSIDLANNKALPVDAGGIPVRALVGEFTIDRKGIVHLQDTQADLLQKSHIGLTGDVDTAKQQLNLTATLFGLTAADLLEKTYEGHLNGGVAVRGSYQNPVFAWELDAGNVTSNGLGQLQTDTVQRQQTLVIKQAKILPDNGGEMDLAGSLELYKDKLLNLLLTTKQFNPNKIRKDFPVGNVNGEAKIIGELGKQQFSGKLQFGKSMLSNVNLSGKADVVYEKQHLTKALTDILLGQNVIKTDGSFGKKGDKLNVDINAPDLGRFGFGLSGLLRAKGYIAGEPKKIVANLNGMARNLRLDGVAQVNNLDFKFEGSPDYASQMNVELKGDKITIPGKISPTVIDAINLFVKGTGQNHTIRGGSSMALGGRHYKMEIDAVGGLNKQNQWKGILNVLDISGAFNLKLQNRMTLEAGSEKVVLGAARWSAMGGSLNLDSFIWDKKNGITTKGRASNLAVSELHNFYTPPVEHNLVLSGDWDLSYSRNMRGYINIRRQSGDIVLPYHRQMLGLGNLTLNTQFQNGRIDSKLDGVTAYGNVNGNVVINQQFGNDISLAPINGHIRISAYDLQRFRNFIPIGQTLKGSLLGDATISGRVGSPQLNGTLNGDNLYYRNQEVGVILSNGSLRSRLIGQRWHIDSLRFQRGGTVTLSGDVNLNTGSPDVDVTALFDHYITLDRPSRRLVLSGDSKLVYTVAKGVMLTGTLKADSGRFGFQKSGMPTLDDDVVVLGEKPKEKKTAMLIAMNLMLDLNNSVRFSGEGLDVMLGGKLNLIAQPGQDVQGVGTVTVVKGHYKAYGQNLEITKGNISFVGPLGNPNLNIRAERRLSPVGAGVEVLGNLEYPRISLVADEPMSEKDKLSWLILNRASSGSDGDEAALASAASALLVGNLNDKIGLIDDFGFTSRRTRNLRTGELNAAEQVLTVGKQLSSELYLGYEYGLESAEQSVKLVYQLTRAIQAIARVGTKSSGGEVKYVIRFD